MIKSKEYTTDTLTDLLLVLSLFGNLTVQQQQFTQTDVSTIDSGDVNRLRTQMILLLIPDSILRNVTTSY